MKRKRLKCLANAVLYSFSFDLQYDMTTTQKGCFRFEMTMFVFCTSRLNFFFLFFPRSEIFGLLKSNLIGTCDIMKMKA